jgi:excisionase family DNA binding protein
MNEKHFFTAAEVARLARVSRQFVTSQCREGKIQAEKVGSTWIIPLNSVHRFLYDRGIIKK